jgi:hypothetical protein
MAFESARLKIKRANVHLQTLERELEDYLKRSPIRIATKWNEIDANFFEFTIDVVEPVPIELSTVIGDFFHNLRTALDLMACELVRMNDQSDDDVHFPFAKSAEELESQIRKRHLDRAHLTVQDLIRTLQPYKNGNAALRGVHDLDIMDKHQTLLPVAGQVRGPNMALGYERLEHIGTPNLARGKARPEHCPDMPIGHTFPAAFKLIVPRGLPFAEMEMIPLFGSLLDYFSRIIDAFETLTSRASARHRRP